MPKSKASGRNYISLGQRRNVNKSLTNAMRRDYMQSAQRQMNQLRAFRMKKRVMVTIPNPNQNETNKRFIRVPAATIWKFYDPKKTQ